MRNRVRGPGSVGAMLVAAVLGATAGCGAEPEPPVDSGEVAEGRALIVDGVVARGPQPGPGGTVDLFRALDITLMGDTLLVAEVGNQRVVMLDRSLRVLATFGRRGAGPGEFESPVAVRSNGDGFVVWDLRNRRFTRYRRDGTYRDEVLTTGRGFEFGLGADDALYVPAMELKDHAVRIRDGVTEPFAARVDTLAPLGPAEGEGTIDDAKIVVTAGDTVHVLDDDRAMLHKYAPDGRLVASRTLPTAVMDSARDRAEKVSEAFSTERYKTVSPLTKEFTATSDGRLLVLPVGTAQALAWIIDPATYTALRIMYPEDPALRAELMATPSAVVAGDVMYVLTEAEILAVRLVERN